MVRPDGEVIWLHATGRVLRDARQRAVRFTGITQNITAARVASEAWRAAVQARDEFLSVASHELKTPLTSRKLQAQLQRRRIERRDPRALTREHVGNIAVQTERQVNRLARLVDDMLDISRIRSGRLAIELDRVDLGARGKHLGRERAGPRRDVLRRAASERRAGLIIAPAGA